MIRVSKALLTHGQRHFAQEIASDTALKEGGRANSDRIFVHFDEPMLRNTFLTPDSSHIFLHFLAKLVDVWSSI